MNETSQLKARIDELEREVSEWKEHAADLGRQLALAKKEKKPKVEHSTTPGFDAFWSAWPTGSRKVNRKACLAKWLSSNLEPQFEEIVAHVIGMKSSLDWTKSGGAFVPAPLVYLNQERYLAPCAPIMSSSGIGFVGGIDYSKDKNGGLN